MNAQKIEIAGIPAMLYGTDSEKLYLFVHGRYSQKEEAENFAQIATIKGFQVLSFDLPEHGERQHDAYPCTVQNGVHDLRSIYDFIQPQRKTLSLFACSLGAYFSLLAYKDFIFETCLFLSPILDMERLIQNMMSWANVHEDLLREKKEIPTSFGETLSWDYYTYVKNNPIVTWNSPTSILYGSNDNLTERHILDRFANKFNCTVEIMLDGEHYFHTEEQLKVLHQWMQNNTK